MLMPHSRASITMSFALRSLVLLTAIGSPVHVSLAQKADPPAAARIAFEKAQDTGLSGLLVARREALEKRSGAPLTGHAWWLWGLSAFDYDRDGDADLLVCVHGSSNGAILKNLRQESGRLAFADVTAELGVDGLIPSTDNYPLVWDFDGDGLLDIAGLLDDAKTSCLWNRAGSKFEKAGFSLHPINGFDALRDLNGDGYVDIRQQFRGKQIDFLYDAAGATFKKVEADAPPPANLPASVREAIDRLREDPNNRFIKLKYIPGDLNGDGQTDLAIQAFGAYSGARLGWYLLAASPNRLQDRTAEMGLPRDGAPLLLADIDHDGDTDVLVASSPQGGLYLNDSRGRFALTPGPLTDFVRQKCPYLQVAFRQDFDNDGDLDLALSSRRYGQQRVLENLGGGHFVTALEAQGWDADPLVLRDIDDDGRLDVIIGGAEGKESVGIFLNRTAGAGRAVQLLPRENKPNPFAVGARVELFRAGALAEENPRPLRIEQANGDGSPIHFGLGTEQTFDLRVIFPGKAALEFSKLKASPKLQINADGRVTSLP